MVKNVQGEIGIPFQTERSPLIRPPGNILKLGHRGLTMAYLIGGGEAVCQQKNRPRFFFVRTVLYYTLLYYTILIYSMLCNTILYYVIM